MPTNVAARMTLSADPGALQGAVAAGILGCGPVLLGTSEECARLLEQRGGRRRARSTGSRAARREGARLRPSGAQAARPPRRAHPRARRRARGEREARRARARGPRRGRRGVGPAADDERLDADRRGDARPRLPRQRRQGGADPRAHGEPARPPGRGAREPDRLPDGRRPPSTRSSTRPNERRRRVTAIRSPTCSSARRSTARSSPAATSAGSTTSPRCRSTDKREVRATVTPENPFGAHLCADPRGDRPHLLHERDHRHAELHPADGG